MSLPQQHVQEFECRDQQINKVTVFNDRAEVKRHIHAELEPGVTEIQVKNVSKNYLVDSLRVDGKGDALIHEVKVFDKPMLDIEKDSPKVAALRKAAEDAKKEVSKLKGEVDFLKKRAKNLDSLINQSGPKLIPTGREELQDSVLENISKLYSFYDREAGKVRNQMTEVQEALEKAEKELKKRETELPREITSAKRDNLSNIFSITLESKAGGKIELEITYQVNEASWYPSYDIRVDSVTTPPTMKLTYFGQIKQETGEDWLEVPVILSTAQPSLGGDIPELPTMEVSFYKQIILASQLMNRGGGGMMKKNIKREEIMDIEECCEYSALPLAITYGTAEQNEKALSTEFTISRPGVVPSASEYHKVTIGIIDLKPQLFYETVPKKSTSVFLVASVLNESSLPLLAGYGSIFLNNSFISKVPLTNVSPGERFICSLGVDQAIRVTHKPKKEFKEKSGMLTKTATSIIEQVINIRNTRQTELLLTVKEQIPRSTTDKIKVKTLQPTDIVADEKEVTSISQEFQLPQVGVKLNKQNNLEWTVKMKPGEVADLLVKYSIERPANQEIEFNEKYY